MAYFVWEMQAHGKWSPRLYPERPEYNRAMGNTMKHGPIHQVPNEWNIDRCSLECPAPQTEEEV